MENLQKFLNKKSSFVFVDKFYHNENTNLHSHDFYEFVFVYSGFTAHKWNGTYSILTPGDVFGMKPGENHCYFNTKDTVIFNCLFYKEAITKHIDLLKQYPGISSIFDLDSHVPFKIHLNLAQRSTIGNILHFIQTECENSNLGRELLIETHLISFLILISRYYEMNGYCTNSEYILTSNIINSIQYIENNYCNPIKSEELAAISKYSTDYFSKVFKAITGITPASYIQIVRISKSIELLLNTQLSISEISAQVGVDDPNYFTRLFKKITGFTPLSYKAESQRKI